MSTTTERARVAAMVLTAMAILVLLSVFAVTARAGGPSPAQLAEQGWTCFVPPPPLMMACFNPAQGRPPIPPQGEDGRATYTAMAFSNPAGEFLGHVHLIRPDLYAGQPCAQTGAPYVFNPRIGYYECVHA
jgi:hypothetical protein